MGRVRERGWLLALPVSACLAFGGCGDEAPPSAHDSADVVHTEPGASPTAASDVDPDELEDLRRFARQEGTTLENELAHQSWVQTFGDDVAALTSDYPDRFAASSVNSIDQDPGATVELVGSIPKEAASYFDDLPVSVTIRGGAPISERDADVLVDVTSDTIAKAVSRRADFAGSYDTTAHRVEFDVHDPLPDHPSGQELATMARDAYGRKHGPVPVEIRVVFSDRPVTDDLVG